MYDANYLSPYLTEYFNPKKAKKQIEHAVTVLKRYHKKYDTIVFTGLSGALIAPDLSRKLNKQLIAIRKEKRRHSYHDVEGYTACKRYVIVDDFIFTGSTVKRIKAKMKQFNSKAVCIGVLEVNDLNSKNVHKHELIKGDK
jgi:adenine/guanine phosphoribosyltransferase-like PRPP-binding protein